MEEEAEWKLRGVYLLAGIFLVGLYLMIFYTVVFYGSEPEMSTPEKKYDLITYVNNTTYISTVTVLSKEWHVQEQSLHCSGFDRINAQKYTIDGMSMRPALKPGDQLYVAKYNPRIGIVEGDIVVASTGVTSRVVHRVTGVYDDGFVMQGDNNPYRDDVLYSYSSILGVVCSVDY